MKYLCIILLLLIPVKISKSENYSNKTSIEYYSYSNKTIVTTTVYYPEVNQTDSTPLITADNSYIDTTKLVKNQIKWIALSRDLLTRWGGKFNYGDTVCVQGTDLDGFYIVRDTMNKRFKKYSDILVHSNYGINKWKNVKIEKVVTKKLII